MRQSISSLVWWRCGQMTIAAFVGYSTLTLAALNDAGKKMQGFAGLRRMRCLRVALSTPSDGPTGLCCVPCDLSGDLV